MAEEEKNENKNKFMDVLARGGEGIVDGLAKSNPVLGGALQAMVNTDEYKARKTEQEAQYLNNQVAIDDARFRLSDDYRNARSAQLQADTATANEKTMLSNENQSDLAVQQRNTARKAAIAQNQYNEQVNLEKLNQLDDQRHAELVGKQQKNLETELSNNPMFNMMSSPERQAFMQSPAIQNMLSASVYMDDLMGIAAGDKESFDRWDRLLNRQKWDLEQGKDGLMYLKMGNLGILPVNEKSKALINQMIHDAALEELQARSFISTTAAMGDPSRRSYSKYANALIPFFDNSAASSVKAVQSVYDNATDEQKTWTFFNQAIQDYADPNLPTTARLAGLQKCIPGLQFLGYAVEGFDEKNPSMDNLRIIKLEEGYLPGKTYSFSQFADLCKANDVISAQLDDMVERNARQFGRQQIVAATQNIKDTAKAAKGEEDESVMQEKKARDAFNKTALQLWGYNYSGLDDDGKDKLYSAKNDFDVLVNQYFERENVDKVTSLSAEALEDLNVGWDKTMKSLKLNSSDFKFPFKELLDAKKKDRDKKKDEEKQAKEADSMTVSDLLRQKRIERETAEKKEKEKDSLSRRAAQQSKSMIYRPSQGFGASYGKASAL